MNKNESKILVQKHLSGILEEKGFKPVKAESGDLNYRKSTVIGYDGYYSSTLNYNPKQIIIDHYYKRIDAVEQIAFALQQQLSFNSSLKKDSSTISFDFNSVNGLKSSIYLPEMETEEDVIKSTGIIKQFILKTAFPMLDRFNDIKEIDKEINGEEPWKTSLNMKFSLGNDFYIKRIIISFLAGSPFFQDIVNFQREELKNGLKGEYFRDFEKALNVLDHLVLLLNDRESVSF